ncbi:MAG: redoxin domain-containing protein [Bacteroidota bacterium]
MKSIRIVILSLVSLFTLSVQAKDGYNITIKIAGLSKQKVLLGYYYGDKQYVRDSGYTDATGKINFKSKDAIEGGIYLLANEQKALLFDFVLCEPEFTLETDTNDLIGNMVVKTSPENTAFFNYSKFTSKAGREAYKLEEKIKEATELKDTASVNRYKAELRKIEQSVNDYRRKAMAETPEMLIAKIFRMMQEITVPDPPKLPGGGIDSMFQYNYYREHYFDNFDMGDDRIVRTPIFHPRLQNYILKVTPQIPDSISRAADFVISKAKSKEVSKWCIYWITNYYETSQYMGMDAVFVHMALKYYNDKAVTYWVDETLRYKIVDRAKTLEYNILGKKAANLTLPDTAGNYQSLYNLKADYTVVVFWDATCGRCKEEMPRLLELYNEQNKTVKAKANKKIDVYAVSLTVEPKVWKDYIRANKIPWTNVHDPNHESNFRKLYDVYSTPVVYLLGKEKKIIAKRLSIEQVKEFIEKGITE